MQNLVVLQLDGNNDLQCMSFAEVALTLTGKQRLNFFDNPPESNSKKYKMWMLKIYYHNLVAEHNPGRGISKFYITLKKDY